MHRRKKWNVGLFSGEAAALALLSVCFLLGSVVGCFITGVMDTDSGTALQEYVQEYMSYQTEQTVRPAFFSLAWNTFRLPLLTFLMGFTTLGIFGLPVLFSIKGFLLSFAVSSFYRLFGSAGEIPAFFLFGLSAMIWLPVLFHLGVQGMLASYGLLRRAAGEGRYPLGYNYRYLVRSGLCAAALAMSVALEYLVVPVLVHAIAGHS